MKRFVASVLLNLYCVCFAQSSSSTVAGLEATSGTPVTVTSISTLAIIILPSSDSSSIPSTTTLSASTISSSSTTSQPTSIVLPTTPYTGQAILTGTCNIPQYTGLSLRDGAIIEVPLVGCSDDRPECCPSLSPPASGTAVTTTSSTITTAPSLSSLTATGVISMLSASPLSICPHDFIDIDPVCCPSGYSLYGQAIVGNTPCYSMLSTIVPIPSSVSNSISSAVAETASATATVSVIINQVFALGLPCAEKPGGGLSTGAKAGIGVGAGVGGLLLIGLVLFILILVGKKRLRRRQQPAPPINTGYYEPEEKHMSSSTGAISLPVGMGSSPLGPMSPQFHPQTGSYSFPASAAFASKQPHASWGSQTPLNGPPQYQLPVEMHVPVTHEIGSSQRGTQISSPDIISSTGSDAQASTASAYETQRGR